ncbi:kinase-like domain-containing protein [Mycena epipterygia]|nr:kinase-like domain-containing protein [Mycena epipterygia]
MDHGTIVHFLNLDMNKNEFIRYQTIHGVVRAIKWLHSKHFVHADIKGANVLVDDKGIPKLGDFGISRLILETLEEVNVDPEPDNGPGATHSLSPGQELNDDSIPLRASNSITKPRIVGSPRWMAPERFDAHSHEPTKQSDVYSFAYLVYEIFANNVPFYESNGDEVLKMRHLVTSRMASRGDPQLEKMRPESLTSDELWNIMVRCMRQEPHSRPKMEEMEKDIGSLVKKHVS